jgi:serine/threonine protein kinase
MSNRNQTKGQPSEFLLRPASILQSRYRIVSQMGKGGMGAVYKAVDLHLAYTVALKQTLTRDEALWKQFEREAHLLAQLNHPVLPRVSDYFTEANRAFFVMQFIDGPDLAEIITQRPEPFPPDTVVAWADQLLDALIYLHARERQIIHRDIKPHNLKVTPTGRIVLLDFGLAKSQSPDTSTPATCTSIFGYTPRYAPLEQIQDLGTSPQSDIYALGATLYHLLTGTKPPDAVSRAAALVGSKPNPLRPANEVNRAIGVELAAILNRAMAQNPDERYASAAEFREVLRGVGRNNKPIVLRSSGHQFAVLPSMAGSDETTTIGGTDEIVWRRGLSPGASAAAVIILILAFAIFCCYYPWKLPPAPDNDKNSVPAAAGQTAHANQTSATSEGRHTKQPRPRTQDRGQATP